MRASSSLSKRGLGVPKKERDDKDTQDGINRLRDLVKLRSFFIETAKFRFERRLRVSAKILSPYRDFSPASAVPRAAWHSLRSACSLPHGSLARFAAATPPRKDKNIIPNFRPCKRRGNEMASAAGCNGRFMQGYGKLPRICA